MASVGLMGRAGRLESSSAVMGNVMTGCQGAGLVVAVSEMGVPGAATASCAGWGCAPAPQMMPQHLQPALQHGKAASQEPEHLPRASPSYDSFTIELIQICRHPGAVHAQHSITACAYRWSCRRPWKGPGAPGRVRPYNKMRPAARPSWPPSWPPWLPGASCRRRQAAYWFAATAQAGEVPQTCGIAGLW